MKLIVELGTDHNDGDKQSDINKIVKCSDTWSIGLSTEKCKIIHLGNQKNPRGYLVAGNKVGVTECERDLTVLISSDATWHGQVNSAASQSCSRIDEEHTELMVR